MTDKRDSDSLHEAGEVPYCCNEKMASSYVYKADDGAIYKTYVCGFCNRHAEVLMRSARKS